MIYQSIYRGVVTDRKDPDKSGRIKVKVPQIFGDEQHEYWAYPRAMFSGKGLGFMAIPELGDLVWIQFEGGDCRYPVWEYGPWKRGEGLSEAYDGDGEPTKLLLQSKYGHLISIDDKSSIITIKHKDAGHVVINPDGISLVLDGSGMISLGTVKESSEPAVLGDKNADVLEDLRAVIEDISQALAKDVIASAATTPQFSYVNITSAAPKAVIDIAKIKLYIARTKSKKVTLD